MPTLMFCSLLNTIAAFSLTAVVSHAADGGRAGSSDSLFPNVALGTPFAEVNRSLSLQPLVATPVEESSTKIYAVKPQAERSFDGYLLFFSGQERLVAMVGICQRAQKSPPAVRTLLVRFEGVERLLNRTTMVGKGAKSSIGYVREENGQLVILELIPATPEATEVESLTITRTVGDADLAAIGWTPLPKGKSAYATGLINAFLKQPAPSK